MTDVIQPSHSAASRGRPGGRIVHRQSARASSPRTDCACAVRARGWGESFRMEMAASANIRREPPVHEMERMITKDYPNYVKYFVRTGKSSSFVIPR